MLFSELLVRLIRKLTFHHVLRVRAVAREHKEIVVNPRKLVYKIRREKFRGG